MLENGKISLRQFTIIVTIFTIGSSILVAPSGISAEAKQDAWLAALLCVSVSMLLIGLYVSLGSRFPDKTLMEYSEIVLGKWLGKAVSFLFIGYFFFLSALLLREIGDFITTHLMPETPIQAIHILFLCLVVMSVRLGLEPTIRAAELFFPYVIALFLLLVAFLSPQMKFDYMQPVLENGIKPVLRGAYHFLGLPFLELVVFLTIFPYVNQVKRAGKAFLTGAMSGGIMLIAIIAIAVSVLTADFTARQVYPSFVLAKKINIANFLQRLEVIMAGIWFVTIFFKLAIAFYASVLGLAQTLKLKDYRVLALPLGVILVVLSLVASPNITYFITFISDIWTPFSLTIGLALPLILLGISAMRGGSTK